MKRINLFAIAMTVVLLMAACTTAADPTLVPAPAQEQSGEENQPTVPPTEAATPTEQPTNTPVPPTDTPEPTPTPQLTVLLEDDFSDVNSGWERYNQMDGMLDYDGEGGYRMFFEISNNLFWVEKELLEQADVIIEVDLTQASGGADATFGVMCRMDDNANFYFFGITGDGQYGIGIQENWQRTWLGTGQLETNADILPTGETNRLRAACVGSTLSLTVNGREYLVVNDETLMDGDNFGMFIASAEEPGNDVTFDNLVVYQP